MKIMNYYKKLLDYLDNGSFFRNPVIWLFVVMAALNLLIPFGILGMLVRNRIFSHLPAFSMFGVILMLIVLFAGFFFLGLYWWMRKEDINKIPRDSQFPVTPIFALIVRYYGEWIGLMVGGVMFVASLIILIFGGQEARYVISSMPMMAAGAGIIALPIYGFLTIVFTRFLSEAIRVLVAIYHNTRK